MQTRRFWWPWSVRLPAPLVLGSLLALPACSSATSPHVRIEVADRGVQPDAALVCAEHCDRLHAPGTGALFNCIRHCPGIEASEGSCARGSSRAICYAKAGSMDPVDRDNAARLAIGMLRGLKEARTY